MEVNKPIPDKLYFRIGDVAEIVGVKPYVLRYWESEFRIISPQKSGTGQRVYKRLDVENLLLIKHLLYTERYSIEGARNRIRELRKEGELKDFRKATVEGASTEVEPETTKRLQGLTRELASLAERPLSDFFKL